MPKLFVVVSGHYLGTTDAAYLHGVFDSRPEAEKVAKEFQGVVEEVELNAIQDGREKDDYHGLPGIRIV